MKEITPLYISGSPYHPRVVDSKMVKLDGDWYSHVDEEGILSLQASQNKRLLFDVSRAGPGITTQQTLSVSHRFSSTPF